MDKSYHDLCQRKLAEELAIGEAARLSSTFRLLWQAPFPDIEIRSGFETIPIWKDCIAEELKDD